MYAPTMISTVFILIMMTTNGVYATCPDGCRCKEITKTVLCSGNYISSVPVGFPPDTEMIVLDGNAIESIKKEDFKGLNHLKTLQLHGNYIQSIEDYSFKDLGNLTEMSLNQNFITRITKQTFYGLSKLETLWMAKLHPLGNVPCVEGGAFEALTSLQTLHLTENDFLYLSDNLFSGLKSLTSLSLTLNRISKISDKAFASLPPNVTLYLGPEATGICCCSTARAINSTQKHSETSCTPPTCLDRNFICEKNYTTTCNKKNPVTYITSSSPPLDKPTDSMVPSTNEVHLPPPTSSIESTPLPMTSQVVVATPIAAPTATTITTTQVPDPEPPAPRSTSICPPDHCQCYHSQHLVTCSGTSLDHIPEEIPADTKTLILINNKIRRIQKYDLYDLHSLEELHLQNNQISDIADGSFQDLRNLTSLFLNKNRLVNINKNTFKGLNKLKVLWLSSMTQTEDITPCIEDDSFKMLTNLQTLQLNGNDFLYFSDALFSGLSKLESLAFSLHRIDVMSPEAFQSLSRTIKVHLDAYDVKICCCQTAEALATIDIGNLQTTCTLDTCSKEKDICKKNYTSTCAYTAPLLRASVIDNSNHLEKLPAIASITLQSPSSSIDDQVFAKARHTTPIDQQTLMPSTALYIPCTSVQLSLTKLNLGTVQTTVNDSNGTGDPQSVLAINISVSLTNMNITYSKIKIVRSSVSSISTMATNLTEITTVNKNNSAKIVYTHSKRTQKTVSTLNSSVSYYLPAPIFEWGKDANNACNLNTNMILKFLFFIWCVILTV